MVFPIGKVQKFSPLSIFFRPPEDSNVFEIYKDKLVQINDGAFNKANLLRLLPYFPKPDYLAYVPNRTVIFPSVFIWDEITNKNGHRFTIVVVLNLSIKDPEKFLRNYLLYEESACSFSYVFDSSEIAWQEIQKLVRPFSRESLLGNVRQEIRQALLPLSLKKLEEFGLFLVDKEYKWTVLENLPDESIEHKIIEFIEMFLDRTGIYDKEEKMRYGNCLSFQVRRGLVMKNSNSRGNTKKGQGLGRLFNVFRKPANSTPEEQLKRRREIRSFKSWKRFRIISSLILIVFGLTITRLALLDSIQVPLLDKTQLMFVLWIPIIAFIIESITAYLRKRSDIEEKNWMDPIFVKLDELGRNNKTQVDRLVRTHCVEEIRTQSAIIDGFISGIQNLEPTDVHNSELRKKLNYCKARLRKLLDDLSNSAVGQPPYMQNNASISEKNWLIYLDEDERLILLSQKLTEELQEYKSTYRDGENPENGVSEYIKSLEEFETAFRGRSRVLRQSVP